MITPHADKHIGENNSGAALDGHGDPHEICANTSVGSVERIAVGGGVSVSTARATCRALASAAVTAVTGYSSSSPLFFGRPARPSIFWTTSEV